jgi:hypothetical protein
MHTMGRWMAFEGPGQIQATRTTVIACTTAIEEMLPLLPDVDYRVLDFGQHVNPEALKRALQQAVDAWATSAEAILLGYGLCSQAVVGLRADDCTLVVPRDVLYWLRARAPNCIWGRRTLWIDGPLSVGDKSPKSHL